MVEQFNEDELNAPDWMNKSFFEKVLRESYNDDSIQIKDLVITPGSGKGDHYASVMFRAVITYKNKSSSNLEKSLIAKTMPFVEGQKKELLGEFNIFEVETRMYKEVVPKFEEVLKNAGDLTYLGGKCVYAASKPEVIIIFEDLTKQGYKTVENWGGSWEIGKKAIEKLAKWHAVSFKMTMDGEQSLQGFFRNGFSDEKINEFPLFKYGFGDFVNMLRNDRELQEFVPKFELLFSGIPMTRSQALFKAFVNGDKANLFVLNHGDFHIKNMMFTERDDGKVDDVLLVDFQMSIWGPAVIDLTYMLYMLLDGASRLTRRNEIIHYYFETFTKTLDNLKYTGEYPKLTGLYKDFITYKDFELMMLAVMLPFTIAMKENPSLELGHFLHSEDIRKSSYKSQNYLSYVKKVLPNFLYSGYLD